MYKTMSITMKAAAAALLLLAGCNEDNHDPEAVPSLKISPEKQAIAFSAAATETFTFEVETNQPVWFAQSDRTWCKVEMDAEAGTFTVSATENTSEASPEPATILVSAGRASEIRITATQAGVNDPALAITPMKETLEFSAEATEEFVFSVTTNQSAWTAESDQTWCKVVMDAEAGTFTVTADANTAETAPAPATITVSAGEAAPILITATQLVAGYDVYLAGKYEPTHGNPIACYWKNGVKTDLTDVSDHNDCSGIVASDGSIYISGTYNYDACYWKDGKMFVMDGYYGTSGIAVENGSVYVLSGMNYWKDGVEVEFYIPDFSTEAFAVSNGKVYIAGNLTIETPSDRYYQAHVLLDNELTQLQLPEGSLLSSAECAASQGGSIHIGGYYNAADGTQLPCYWKDGQHIPLDVPEGARDGEVTAICVDEAGKVYAAGRYHIYDGKTTSRYFCYWVDGVRKLLEKNSEDDDYEIRGIAVAEGKVYVGGYMDYNENNMSFGHPCQWVEGKITVGEKEPRLMVVGIALLKR